MQTEELPIRFSDLTIDRQEIRDAMGYRDEQPDQQVEQMLDEVLMQTAAVCRPLAIWTLTEGTTEPPVGIRAGETRFRTGKIICDSLTGSERFCLFIVSAGAEFEAFREHYRNEGDCVREFIADSVGSVVAEACVTAVERELEHRFGDPHTLPYSPGYCGWRVTEQQTFFGLFPPRPAGVRLTESSLMFPIKSVSGVIGIGAGVVRKPYGCAICNNTSCYKRKTN